MSNTKPRVAILTNVIPKYRERFYRLITSNPDYSVTIFCQPDITGSNLHGIHEKFDDHVRLVDYLAYRGEELVWQRLPWRHIIRNYDIIVVDGNPRSISQSLLAFVLRMLGRKVAVWSSVYSYRDRDLSRRLRLLWWKQFNSFYLYTQRDVEELRKAGFQNAIAVAANNGLDQQSIETQKRLWPADRLRQWQQDAGIAGRQVILSSGRLIPKNRYDQVARAMPAIVQRHPNVLWCVIGDGPVEDELKSIVSELGLGGHVRMLGAIYEEAELAPWFLSSALLVHPAAIGLSLMHAFGYGLPVVTHDNWRHHNPEYAVFEPGGNGESFREDDVDHLAEVINALLADPERRQRLSLSGERIAREHSNTDIMAQQFSHLVQLLSA
jgi:glycosyltransferase involved in cell wall biosynthesis